MKFYDRKAETEALNGLSPEPFEQGRFVLMFGRRRFGKTALLLQAFKGRRVLYLLVTRDSEAVLCERFQKKAEDVLGVRFYGHIAHFRDLFDELIKASQEKPFILIIDEFQDLSWVNPAIFSHIQNLWDENMFKKRPYIIACGSIYSLMIRIFSGQHEPLMGRTAARFHIGPFDISVIKQILKDYNPKYTNEDLLCLYMLTGGVPYYIGLLLDSKAWTKTKMLRYALSENSKFITDGKELLVSEFGKNYGEYFSILQLIARGMTTQSEIDSVLGYNTGSYIANLETEYSLIRRNKPLFSKPGSRNSRWLINDNYFRFYFRYIERNPDLVETKQFDKLYDIVMQDYTSYTGLVLENYFRQKIAEEGGWTKLGRWWDRKGKNEIDILTYDELKHKATVYEVKRQKKKIDLSELKNKAELIKAELPGYTFSYKGLGLEDM
ncbi:MAG: ATP-binding protein [Spirochaetaceae bacterium]|jgi:AAA+ ATPase superfamily predicted ATPase|nr:ATP-binding protein [Spirochaetaceae bacterium]